MGEVSFYAIEAEGRARTGFMRGIALAILTLAIFLTASNLEASSKVSSPILRAMEYSLGLFIGFLSLVCIFYGI